MTLRSLGRFELRLPTAVEVSMDRLQKAFQALSKTEELHADRKIDIHLLEKQCETDKSREAT